MKKTQRKDAVRNVKKRVVSFLSICLVSALGLAALFTTHYMAEGLDRGANEYFEQTNFKDFDMVSSTGISKANVEKIAGTEGVSAAEGVVQADGALTYGDSKIKVTVMTKTEEVSVPDLVDGRNPISKDECMIGEDVAEIYGIKIGDKVGLSLTGLDMLGEESPLYSKEFKITGLMHHPNYFRRKSTNTVVIPLKAVNEEATQGLFTYVYIKAEGPEGVSIFNDKYFEGIEGTTKRLDALTGEIAEDRTNEMKSEAYAKIDEEWAKAEAELENAEGEIAAGEAELNRKLAEGRSELNKAQRTLDEKVRDGNEKIRKGEKKLAEGEKTLNSKKKEFKAAKKALKEAKKEFEKQAAEVEPVLYDMKEVLDNIEKSGVVDTEAYKEAEKAVAKYFSKHPDELKKLKKKTEDPKIRKELLDLDEYTGRKIGEAILEAADNMDDDDLKTIIKLSEEIAAGEDKHYDKEALKAVTEALDKLTAIREEFDAAEKKLSKAETKILEGEETIDYMRDQIDDGKETLQEEKAKAEKKIKAGWAEYYAQKAKYENKLEEAKALLEENRELAEQKLEEAKAEVEKLTSNCILLDKKANAGYVDIKSNINSIKRAGMIMGILFMVITAIVCFSTLVIIIDEQKELVGTTKAFGFFKREVLGKYLTFGALSALAGCALGIIISLFGAEYVQGVYHDIGVYQMDRPRSVVLPGLTIICCLIIIAVTCLASIISCTDILRSPASLLMKGAVLKKPKKNKQEKTSKRGGSLYSKLIVRNMKDDKARVIVTIAIIAFSTLMMGVGLSIKFAYDEMIEKQMNEIHKYDIKVTMNDDVTDKQEKQLAAAIDNAGASYLPAAVETRLYDWEGRLDGLQLICGDSDKLNDFFAVTDFDTGEPLKIPDSGVLIQKRMNQSYNMKEGDTVTVLDSSLDKHNAKIDGYFLNYVGRTVIASPKAYKEIFGKDMEPNSFFIKLDGADQEALKKSLLAVTQDISFESKSDFASKFDAVSIMFNIVVIITTGIAILMSFMILTNLANIYLTRKKTELTIMRVNGFSVKETKGYLSKESILTTGLGILIGLVVGAIAAPYIITPLQQPDLEFVKSFHVIAWVVAVVLEALFAIIINSSVFNKVKKLNLKDIA